MMSDAQTNKLYIGEVGGNDQSVASEDIHVLDLSKSGKNFGWPNCEGYCNNPDYAATCSCAINDNPLYAYTHKDSNAPTGSNAAIIIGPLYRGGMFGAPYTGSLFFADYSRNSITYLPLKADGSGTAGAPVTFDTATYGCIGMESGPDGSLWLNSIYGIERIYTAGGNQPPTISKATASTQAGPLPLVVSFQGLATDPEGKAVTYAWDFGDGTTSTQQNPTKTYSTSGTYAAYLRVSDGSMVSTSTQIKIEAGNKPVVKITSPVPNIKFVANQVITLAGTATYNGNPVTATSAFVWNVLLFHDDHTHPIVTNAAGPSTTLTIPSFGHSFEYNTYFILSLTCTQGGLQTIASVNIYPTKSYALVKAIPSTISLVAFVDGVPRTTPFVSDQLVGFTNTLTASPTYCYQNKNYNFASWSDGKAATHDVVAPSGNYTLTVTYVQSGTCVSGPSCFTFKSCGQYLPGEFF